MAHLKLDRLTKTYRNGTVAVADMSFEVRDREAVFILGPSGAGKTTSLRLVAGLEDPDSGNIEIGGRSVVHDTPGRRNVAMVYDRHSLFPHLSVFENMAYPLRIRKMSDAAMRTRIMSVAETLQIQELLDRMPAQLSGGQMQRVAIGRALVRDADVFLMDEPIAHLDAQLRARMRVEFKRLQKEFNATILYVSHDQLEAMTMSDRIVVIDKGRVEQIGPPQEIFDHPVSRFVATFVGEPMMNTIPVRLVEEAGRYWIEIGTSRVAADGEWLKRSGAIAAGDPEFILGVRPQHLQMAPASTRGDFVVHGKVYAVESLGSRAVFDVDIGERLVRVMTTSSEAAKFPWSINAPVGFTIDPGYLYLFDRTTGKTVAQAAFAKQKAARKPYDVPYQEHRISSL